MSLPVQAHLQTQSKTARPLRKSAHDDPWLFEHRLLSDLPLRQGFLELGPIPESEMVHA